MKKYYYFSKSKLKFVEIRNFYRKFVFLVLFFSVIASFFLFGSFLVLNEMVNPDIEVKSLKKKNEQLLSNFKQLAEKYKSLDEKINSLKETGKDLRLATNLDPIPYEDFDFGKGGNIISSYDFTKGEQLSGFVNDLNSYVSEISTKIKTESDSYKEISTSLKTNEAMYDNLPAIKPAEGILTDGFGMRFHPILKITRMHNGVDIICDIGTKVYATGGGTVDFAGRRGGYGLTLEIDHGFGYRTIFGHLSDIKVKVGQKVTRGDLVAFSGNSGKLSTGPHCHYEVRHNGIPLNPMNFIFEDVDLFEIVKK